MAELHLALSSNSIGSEFAGALIGLQHRLPDVRVELLEVERMKIFQPLRQERCVLLHIIPIIPRLGLAEPDIDIPEVFDCTPPPLVLLVHQHIADQNIPPVRGYEPRRRPVELGQEPAEPTALYRFLHAQTLLDNGPLVPYNLPPVLVE